MPFVKENHRRLEINIVCSTKKTFSCQAVDCCFSSDWSSCAEEKHSIDDRNKHDGVSFRVLRLIWINNTTNKKISVLRLYWALFDRLTSTHLSERDWLVCSNVVLQVGRIRVTNRRSETGSLFDIMHGLIDIILSLMSRRLMAIVGKAIPLHHFIDMSAVVFSDTF